LSFSLALPTASSGPDPLAHLGLYNSNNGAAAGGVSTSASVSGAMESDDEWDEILAQPDRSVSSSSSAHHSQQRPQQQEPLTIMMEDDADADVDDGLDFLERELLGEDEPMGDGDGDEEEEDLEEEIIGHASSSRVGAGAAGPMSMNQFAGGDAVLDDDDDDFSSSEESEED
jgi:hypothetical protein